MVSALYVVIGTLFIVKFSVDVIRLRLKLQVSTGDGGHDALRLAIRVHGNAVEYIPLALLLLVVMEMNGAAGWLVHLCALLFFAGRMAHAWGLRRSVLRWRRNGMMMTLLAIIAMLIANLLLLPWDRVLSLH